MSYWAKKGKYQKAFDFLWSKLVPPEGQAKNALGEALRLVVRAANRYYNDGDSYEDCIDEGMIPDFSKKKYPFDGEYHSLGLELDSLLSSGEYDAAISLVLFNIMLSLSSTTHIYNPATNRLVEIDTEAGKKALKALDINTVFINYCGKNEDWLPEQLRKDGVKITKLLSSETRKELKCDTIEELHQFSKTPYSSKNKTRKIQLSHDNSILSKKFKKIESQHKKSVKEAQKKMKERQKHYEQGKKRDKIRKGKHLTELKKFYETLKDMTISVRADTLKKMKDSRLEMNPIVKMALIVLLEYKEKKTTTKSQKEHRSKVISTLVPQLNIVGGEISEELSGFDADNTIYSFTTNPNEETRKKLDDSIVQILGSEEAADNLYQRCCRY